MEAFKEMQVLCLNLYVAVIMRWLPWNDYIEVTSVGALSNAC